MNIQSALVCAVLLSPCLGWAQEPVPRRPAAEQPGEGASERPAQQDPQDPQGGEGQSSAPLGWVFSLDRLSKEEWADSVIEAERLARTEEAHRRLAAMAGTFEVTVTMQPLPSRDDGKLPTAGGAVPREPAVAKGTATARAILGGRYLMVELTLPIGGREVSAIYMLGYDRLRELWTLRWNDTLSTWTTECVGVVDPADKNRVIMGGTLRDPATPTGRDFRLDLRLEQEGRFSLSMLEFVGKAPRVLMRQDFLRQK